MRAVESPLPASPSGGRRAVARRWLPRAAPGYAAACAPVTVDRGRACVLGHQQRDFERSELGSEFLRVCGVAELRRGLGSHLDPEERPGFLHKDVASRQPTITTPDRHEPTAACAAGTGRCRGECCAFERWQSLFQKIDVLKPHRRQRAAGSSVKKATSQPPYAWPFSRPRVPKEGTEQRQASKMLLEPQHMSYEFCQAYVQQGVGNERRPEAQVW